MAKAERRRRIYTPLLRTLGLTVLVAVAKQFLAALGLLNWVPVNWTFKPGFDSDFLLLGLASFIATTVWSLGLLLPVILSLGLLSRTGFVPRSVFLAVSFAASLGIVVHFFLDYRLPLTEVGFSGRFKLFLYFLPLAIPLVHCCIGYAAYIYGPRIAPNAGSKE